MPLVIRRFLAATASLLLLSANAVVARGETATKNLPPAPTNTPDTDGKSPMSYRRTTWGGAQLWTDQLLYGAWRIQSNCPGKVYRLLDGEDELHFSGTFEDCRERLAELAKERRLAPPSGKIVILLHGLGRTRRGMMKLASYLESEGDYTALTMGYASTRDDIDGAARALGSIVANLPQAAEISFVGHSLGNIVVRRYMAMAEKRQHGLEPDARVKRFVMLAPPNTSAKLAEMLSFTPMLSWIGGPAAHALGPGRKHLGELLATPRCEFGIIAGGRGDGAGFNPLLPGDDDLIVTVEETKLPGAHDFQLVRCSHTFIMDHKDVRPYTLRFLDEGHFVDADHRQPLKGS